MGPSTLSLVLVSLVAAAPQPPCARAVKPLELPQAKPGIGFDDLQLAPALHALLVPAGRTGMLDLVDPATEKVTSIAGFSALPRYGGGHDDSVTSASEGAGLLFATDRTSTTLSAIDPASHEVVATVPLAGGPDYVRYVAPTHEVWVTEPDKEQIEIFTMSEGKAPRLAHAAQIAVPGGPESLIVDAALGRAFTHLWKGQTLSIDLRTRTLGTPWKNGCEGSRGIALDGQGAVIVACSEGTLTFLDERTGAITRTLHTDLKGVDVIDVDPARGHVYLAGGKSRTLAIVGIGARRELSVLATLPTAPGAHCVLTDRAGKAYVCDPEHGSLMVIEDRCRAPVTGAPAAPAR